MKPYLFIVCLLLLSCGTEPQKEVAKPTIKTEVSSDRKACFCTLGQLRLLIPLENATLEACIPLCERHIPRLKEQFDRDPQWGV